MDHVTEAAAPGGGRPCRFCVAQWAVPATKEPRTGPPPVPEPEDCEMTHRDDPRVYALARALAEIYQAPAPTDAQISYFLGDADDVVDDFDPPPAEWRVQRLPDLVDDDDELPIAEIESVTEINGVVYVCLEGGKDTRSSMTKLETWRSWF